jgi:hypothetical protein
MPTEGKRHRIRSFLVGSVLGGLVVLVAPHARRRRLLTLPRGLAAFDGAPCATARVDGTPDETGATGGVRAS